jgi:hypothetical protein
MIRLMKVAPVIKATFLSLPFMGTFKAACSEADKMINKSAFRGMKSP